MEITLAVLGDRRRYPNERLRVQLNPYKPSAQREPDSAAFESPSSTVSRLFPAVSLLLSLPFALLVARILAFQFERLTFHAFGYGWQIDLASHLEADWPNVSFSSINASVEYLTYALAMLLMCGFAFWSRSLYCTILATIVALSLPIHVAIYNFWRTGPFIVLVTAILLFALPLLFLQIRRRSTIESQRVHQLAQRFLVVTFVVLSLCGSVFVVASGL